MKTQFRRAMLPDELKRLVAFDHKVFDKADWFTKSYGALRILLDDRERRDSRVLRV